MTISIKIGWWWVRALPRATTLFCCFLPRATRWFRVKLYTYYLSYSSTHTTNLLIGLNKSYFFLLFTVYFFLHFFLSLSLLYTFFYIRHPFFFFGEAKEEKIVKLKSILFGNNVIIYYICHFVTIHKNRYFLAIM